MRAELGKRRLLDEPELVEPSVRRSGARDRLSRPVGLYARVGVRVRERVSRLRDGVERVRERVSRLRDGVERGVLRVGERWIERVGARCVRVGAR